MDEEIKIKGCSLETENESTSFAITSHQEEHWPSAMALKYDLDIEFLPPEYEALRSILECLHWRMHILHYRVTLTRTPELAWMLILASSAAGWLSTDLQYMCRRDNSATLHLQQRLGMHKEGIKTHSEQKRREFSLKVIELYLGEGLVETPNKRKDPSLALN